MGQIYFVTELLTGKIITRVNGRQFPAANRRLCGISDRRPAPQPRVCKEQSRLSSLGLRRQYQTLKKTNEMLVTYAKKSIHRMNNGTATVKLLGPRVF